jgi:hypothetical protein
MLIRLHRNCSPRTLATLGLLVLGAMAAPVASAGCGDIPQAPKGGSGGQATKSVFRTASFMRVSDHEDDAAITGLWSFTFISQGTVGIPDGTVVDAGYVTWHADGTELMNSGRAPLTQSFCMGVWKQTNWSTFTLNHFALSWSPDGSTFVGPANIQETVTVDFAGDSYTGTFSIDQSDTKGNNLAHVVGQVTAKRITVTVN